MKRLFGVFELSKSEQRVVLLVIFVLIVIAFVGYERRVRYFPAQQTSATETEGSPTPVEAKTDQ
jgi:hypothetical protein